jgi:hypothetical protein
LNDVRDDDADRTAKARFYLKHRDLIEEWAALRAEARGLLELSLLGLETTIARLADELECEAYVSVDDAIMTLYRPQWKSRSTTDVSIGFGWDRRRLLSPGYTEWAWVGAYLEGADTTRGRAHATNMKTLRQPHGYSSGNPWVLWRPVVPAVGVPIEPDDYAEKVAADVRRSWEVIAPAVDRTTD